MMSSFEEFCNGGIWNTSLLVDPLWPEVTPCFASTIPIWAPCFYVWLLLPFVIWKIKRAQKTTQSSQCSNDDNDNREKHPTDCYDSNGINHTNSTSGDCERYQNLMTPIFVSKLVLMVLQTFISGIEVIHLLVASFYPVDILSGFILLATYIVICLFMWWERKKGEIASFIYFFFFASMIALGLVRVYMWVAIWGIENGTFSFITLVILFGLNIASLIMTFFPERLTCSTPSDYQMIVQRPPCPEQTSPFPSRLCFTWMSGLMLAGFRKDLNYDDVWMLNTRDMSATLNPPFERLLAKEITRVKKINERRGFSGNERKNGLMSKNDLTTTFHYSKANEASPLLTNGSPIHSEKSHLNNEEKRRAKINIMLVVSKLFWKTVVIAFFQKLSGDILIFMGPLILGAFINLLESGDDSKLWQAYALSAVLWLCGISRSFLFAQAMYRGSLIALHIKTIFTNAIYKKALTICGSAKKNTTVGEIVNLMSVDCQRLQEMMTLLVFASTAPLQAVVAVYFLYNILGVSIFTGLFLMVCTVPINSAASQIQKKLQRQVLDVKGQRIRLVNEILNGMKVLKLYTWELEFKKKVEVIRQMEIVKLFKLAITFMIMKTMAGLIPFMVGFFTFMTYIYVDDEHVLDAEKAFVSLALFNLLRIPMIHMTTIIIFGVQMLVCFRRINEFLSYEDLDFTNVTHDDTNNYAIEIKSGTFSWDKDDRLILNDINIAIPEGSLVAIIGPIGSGKSSLIHAMLGELHKLQGQVNVKGKLGYVSQQAWIQNATVKDNILFGNKYDRLRYNDIIRACQLTRDFEILDAGDQTEIGEKGINISGGQKQRVNLARAAYSQSDIFLFDDPLSAVDAHVGKAIFDELIGPDGLLFGKTRILVTHGLQWLPKVDKIFVLSDTNIIEQGTYNELINKKGYFTELIKLYSNHGSEVESTENLLDKPCKKDHDCYIKHETLMEQQKSRKSKLSEPIQVPDELNEMSLTLTENIKNIHPEPIKLTQVETLEMGQVSWTIYGAYFKAAGVVVLPIAFLSYISFYALSIGSNFWLSEWTKQTDVLNETTNTSEESISMTNYYLLRYGLFGIAMATMHITYSVIFWPSMVRAGRKLHNLLLERIFHAPMSFFDQTPIGRILNRFSRDVDIVDNNLPMVVQDFITEFLMVSGTIVVILIKTPLFAIVLVPLTIFFLVSQSLYVRASRQLKRMESIKRSPVYTHFSETITGASVIRAYGVTERFIKESEERIDENQVYFFASQAAIRWLQLNLEVIASFVIFFAAVFQIVDGGGGSDAGLSVSYALQITGIMTYMVRQVCEFETNIVCIERMKEYTQIEQEADFIISHQRPDKKWPEMGCVNFYDYTLRYRPGLQLVLKGVCCDIKETEKVGIVGRTGAGKSSLTLGLFRIIEAAGGSIVIDGVNIASIGLHDLRRSLTILPQDPVIFSGSLRMNIDPFNEHTDEELWMALEHSHLKKFVADQPDKLLYECGEEGTNLSIGQRQLVCLARALLRKTKILILDEATAAVDLETDALIQTTIRTAFQDCTILAIAHRLTTIMDYDKVMVMDTGIVREFDSPKNLLRSQGEFYTMCKDAGLV